MNTKTKSQLLTQSHGVKPVAGVDTRVNLGWPSFSGVLLSIQSTGKMIAAQRENSNPATINGMIDYTGEVLERRLDKK